MCSGEEAAEMLLFGCSDCEAVCHTLLRVKQCKALFLKEISITCSGSGQTTAEG